MSPDGILHVLADEESGPATRRSLARTARPGDAVVLLGAEGAVARLRGAGLDPAIPVVARPSVGGSWALAQRLGGFDAVRRLFARAEQDGSSAGKVVAHGPLACAIAEGLAHGPVRREVAAMPPGFASSPARRMRLRRALGVRADESLVLLLAEPPSRADARFAVRAIGMAAVGGARLRLLASPHVARIGALASWLRSVTGGPPSIIDARADDLAEVGDAVDAVILDADGRSTDPVETGARARPSVVDRLLAPLLARGRAGSPHALSAPSALPALEAIATGIPACVHRSIDCSAAGAADAEGGVLLHRHESDVAELCRTLAALKPRGQILERNATAASR